MNTETKVYQQRNNDIDIPAIIRALVRSWWVILLCGCILGMWSYMGISLLKNPVYTSQATLVITNSGNDDAVYTDTALEKVAGQYQKILSSNTLKNTVQKELGVENLPGNLSASIVPETNLIILQSTSAKPGDAYLLAKSAIQNYSKVSDYVISSFVLEVMKEPSIPTIASNAGLERTWAVKGFLIGILGTALLIAVLCFMRDDIKNENQVTALLDTKLFASIYFEKKPKKDKKTSILITNPVTSFFYGENIRKMATKLDYYARKNHHKVILVTSVRENEGKSTIAANLALALANKNRRVLLMDADLRKPDLYKVFDKKITPEIEFSNYLDEKSTFQDVLSRDRDTGLYYVFGTRSFRNSDIRLSSDGMRNVFKMARRAVDYVIVDTPPAGMFPDAEIMADYADAGILVVRQQASRIPDINDTLDTLKKTNMEVYGCVLNAVHTKVLPKSAEYGYSYGYGGKYGRYNRYGKYGKYGKTTSSGNDLPEDTKLPESKTE